MVAKKGGPFFRLLEAHIRAGEYSFNAGDFQNAISHMQSLAELLNVKLPRVPYHDPRFTATPLGDTSKNERHWLIISRPLVAKAVRKWMNAHMDSGGVTIAKDDEEDDQEVESE
jgi:hypothetical protein